LAPNGNAKISNGRVDGWIDQTNVMSTKEIVHDLLQKLPEDISLHDIAREIEFVAAVRQGLAEIERGERIPIEEVERELPS
jgi:hypothetical protein